MSVCLYAGTEGQVWVLPMQCPLQPVLLTSTLPALPNTQLVPLSRDYFILADTQSLQLWDNKFYTCQHSISTAGCQGSKVSLLIYKSCSADRCGGGVL